MRDVGVATDAVSDESLAIQLIGSLRQWAIRVLTAHSASTELAPSEGLRSDAPWTDVVAGAPGKSVIRSMVAPDHTGDLDKVETTDDAESWAELLSPAIVALSVALVAQAGRRFARWWKLRNRSRARAIAKHRDRGSPASEPASEPAVPGIDGSNLAETPPLVSRAS
jgi:hypothetical protein